MERQGTEPMARRWALTLQLESGSGFTEEDFRKLIESFTSIRTQKRTLTFFRGQLEQAPSTGTLHVQGAVAISQPVRLATMKKWIPRAHWEQARDWQKLVEYCSKKETRVAGPWEHGTETKQGQRSDLQAAAQLILSGSTMTQIASEMPEVIVKYHKGLQYLRSLQQQQAFQPKKIGLFWGTTGTGKTYTAFNELQDIYTVFCIKTPWFDGYQGQENVLLDECGVGMMNYNYLKRILDGYRMDVPVKGGSAQWTPKTVILTSNIPLEEWYPFIPKADLDALKRRIRIFNFPEDKRLAEAWLRGALIEPPPSKRQQDEGVVVEPPSSMEFLQRQNMDTYDAVGY